MDPMDEDSKKIFDENKPKDDVSDELFCYTDSSSETTSDDASEDDFDVITNDMEDPKLNTLNFLKEPYKIMSEEEIRQNQQLDVKNISDILNITTAEASLVLVHCNWSVNAVTNRWFTNGAKLREELGLSEICFFEFDTPDGKTVTCGLCSLTFSREQVASPPCGHMFCTTCWAESSKVHGFSVNFPTYIGGSLKNGMDSLLLRCPNLTCKTAVDTEMINMLASDTDKAIYAHYFLRSYIDYNPKAKWCPNPGCNHAVILANITNHSKVTCNCSYTFCWKCMKEAHQPASCFAANSWETECSKKSDNWVSTNSKSCPNCRESFEVDGRYKRVECTACKAQFCRLCFTSWLDNGYWQGDQYNHICSERKQKGIEMGGDERRKTAESLMRFEATVGQWKAHDKHLQDAMQEIQDLKNGKKSNVLPRIWKYYVLKHSNEIFGTTILKALADKQRINEAEFNFVTEAWLQIADCKRVFKWFAVYMYYLPKSEDQQTFLVDYLLRRGEFVSEHLSQTTSELKNFFEEPSVYFSQFRSRLCLLTSVARNYFDNMVWAIENGETDLNELRSKLRSRMIIVESGSSTTAERNIEQSQWTCAHCQVPNEDTSLCVMCFH